MLTAFLVIYTIVAMVGTFSQYVPSPTGELLSAIGIVLLAIRLYRKYK